MRRQLLLHRTHRQSGIANWATCRWKIGELYGDTSTGDAGIFGAICVARGHIGDGIANQRLEQEKEGSDDAWGLAGGIKIGES